MARKPALHSADQLLGPSVERTIKAIDPPDSDAALVALARICAGTVDRMTDAERAEDPGRGACPAGSGGTAGAAAPAFPR